MKVYNVEVNGLPWKTLVDKQIILNKKSDYDSRLIFQVPQAGVLNTFFGFINFSLKRVVVLDFTAFGAIIVIKGN